MSIVHPCSFLFKSIQTGFLLVVRLRPAERGINLLLSMQVRRKEEQLQGKNSDAAAPAAESKTPTATGEWVGNIRDGCGWEQRSRRALFPPLSSLQHPPATVMLRLSHVLILICATRIPYRATVRPVCKPMVPLCKPTAAQSRQRTREKHPFRRASLPSQPRKRHRCASPPSQPRKRPPRVGTSLQLRRGRSRKSIGW